MEQSLAPLGVLAPFAIVERAVDKRVASSSVTFIVIPVAVVLIAIEVVHDAMSLLIIAIPQADVLVVVQEVIRAVSVLMTIHPRALVAFAVGKREGAFALSSSAHVFAFILVAILIDGHTLSIRFSVEHLAFVFADEVVLANRTRAQRYLLCQRVQREQRHGKYNHFVFQHFVESFYQSTKLSIYRQKTK